MSAKTKFIFELTKDECIQICEQKIDCSRCALLFSNGVCAKDIVSECKEMGMKELLRQLLKEIEIYDLQSVSREMESTQHN